MTPKTAEKQSLLEDAFETLIDNLGAEKTIRVWQVLTSSKQDYQKIRHKLFANKDLAVIYNEAKKFNRK